MGLSEVFTLSVVALLKFLEEAELILYEALNLDIVGQVASLERHERLGLAPRKES